MAYESPPSVAQVIRFSSSLMLKLTPGPARQAAQDETVKEGSRDGWVALVRDPGYAAGAHLAGRRYPAAWPTAPPPRGPSAVACPRPASTSLCPARPTAIRRRRRCAQTRPRAARRAAPPPPPARWSSGSSVARVLQSCQPPSCYRPGS
eukprot:scaffold102449_cov48-Phaeocystis_antarctica.AAC.2